MIEDVLMHYGTKYHSGRYPYGSGDAPYQHEADFLGAVEKMRKEGGLVNFILEGHNKDAVEFKNKYFEC